MTMKDEIKKQMKQMLIGIGEWDALTERRVNKWLDANYKEPERLSMEKVLGIFENELYAEKYTELNGDVYYVVEGKQKAAEQICKLIPDGEGEAVEFGRWLSAKTTDVCNGVTAQVGYSYIIAPFMLQEPESCVLKSIEELYSLFLTDKAKQ